MATVCVTGSASGMGAATAVRLQAAGVRVIGVDQRDADVVADLSQPDGRELAVEGVTSLCGGVLDGLVTFAGIGGLPGRPGSLLASVNYFGTVDVMTGLRPALARAERPAAVAISSNSTTTSPNIPTDLVETLLNHDEAAARAIADGLGDYGSMSTYPASKVAVARWVRRNAPTTQWIGANIRLNAVAPGYVETPMTAEGRNDPQIGPFIEAFQVPAGRGNPDDITPLIEFLLGPDARYFCGSVIFCDGGTDALHRADDWPAPMTTG